MHHIKRLILLGPQASGKSTQGKLIADFLQIPILTSGQILREEIRKNTDIGRQVADLVNHGSLIPDSLMVALIEKELSQPKYQNGFLLDGFPRSIAQAKALDALHQIDQVVNINITDTQAINRVSGRRICPNGHIYNVISNPTSQAGICDICDKPLGQREDDKEEVIKKRLALYHQETVPLIKFYQAQGKLVPIDGNNDIKQVSEDILAELKLNDR